MVSGGGRPDRAGDQRQVGFFQGKTPARPRASVFSCPSRSPKRARPTLCKVWAISGDRHSRKEVADRSDKSDRSDRSDRSDKADRSDRSDKSDRSDRSDKSDESDRSDRSDKADRSDNPSPAPVHPVRPFHPVHVSFGGPFRRVHLPKAAIRSTIMAMAKDAPAGCVTERGRLNHELPSF